MKFAKSKLKYFDCLINNASLFENDKLENFSTANWGRHLRTNLRSPALLSKEFAKNIKVKNKLYPKGRSTMGMPGTRAQKGKKKWKQIK